MRTRLSAPKLIAATLVLLIGGYRRLVSPFLGPRCRFYPTCSEYAATAIRVHGPGRGLLLAVRRLAHCHPWNPGGYDPVPPAEPNVSHSSSSVVTAGATRC